MKIADVKHLKEVMAGLPVELTTETQEVFAAFGKECANKYVPELLKEAGLYNEVPEFEINSCESCYWIHQKIKYGCADCKDKSAYVDSYGTAGPKCKAEYEKSLRK